MYLEIKTNKYPVYLNQIKFKFPNTSFPEDIDDLDLTDFGYIKIILLQPPIYDQYGQYLEELPPKLNYETNKYEIDYIIKDNDLDKLKKEKLELINKEISEKITFGFSMIINEKLFHFNYDRDDQQNFVDIATSITQSFVNITIPENQSAVDNTLTINWKGYDVNDNNKLTKITLSAVDFLTLYNQGALVHKANQMEIGETRKEHALNAKNWQELKEI